MCQESQKSEKVAYLTKETLGGIPCIFCFELRTVLTSLYFQLWRLHQWTSRSWSGNLSMATRLNLFYQINWICMFKEIIMFILKYAIPICNTKGYEQIAVFGFWYCDFLTADEPFKKYLINSLIHLSVCHKMSQQKRSRDVLFEYHWVVVEGF